jgi:hypothetical protein
MTSQERRTLHSFCFKNFKVNKTNFVALIALSSDNAGYNFSQYICTPIYKKEDGR